ncbi:hypothetical protein EXIGLDRAFT_790400 [Exidia glandulosa HHB12029]|uniref:C2H2-type domain-containing protein n=1 Tax=Exidia glandulosa HHB12029 TaxID=1314781 RepID=A0A165HRW2_EXIGL|nr:hypothetical protein EXIGLDRAFT_790400 [Exidia glandulosa HHB12029]
MMVVDHLRKRTPYEEFSCGRCDESRKYRQSLKYHTAKSCLASKPSGSATRASDDEDEEDSNNASSSERSTVTAKARPLSPAGSESSPGTPQLCLWPECSSEFSLADPAALGEHICDHFVEGGGEECHWDDCGDEFADAGLYRQHVKDAHLPEWETPFQCPRCPKQFKKKAGIVVHIEHLHPSNGSAAKTASPNKSPSKKRALSSDEEEEEQTSKKLRPRRSTAIAKKKKMKGSPAKATGAKAEKQKNETPDIWAQMRDVIEDEVTELIQETVARKLGLAKL